MKKLEKILLGIFGSIIAVFLIILLDRLVLLDMNASGFFDGIGTVLAFGFAVSLIGAITILVSWRTRCRAQNGQKPISALYRAGFWLSFIPFVLLIISSAEAYHSGFSFMGETWYGTEAFWDTLIWNGVLMFSAVIPLFPVIIYWQLLFIVKRIKYRKQMKAVSE